MKSPVWAMRPSLQLVLDQPQRQPGPVERDVQPRKDVGKPSRMVLVSVGDEDGQDLLAIGFEVGDVGHDVVDAGKLLVGEHQPAVDDDHVVPVLHHVHVFSNLAEPSQGDEAQVLLALPNAGRLRPPARPCSFLCHECALPP